MIQVGWKVSATGRGREAVQVGGGDVTQVGGGEMTQVGKWGADPGE